MKAGQLFGVAEYKNSCAEMLYESSKKEPIGKPHVRGHTLKMLPEGFGNKSGEPVHAQFRYTHNNYKPGERINRNYNFPEVTKDKGFRFGGMVSDAIEGEGMKMVMNGEVEDDNTAKQTKIVQRVCEGMKMVMNGEVEDDN